MLTSSFPETTTSRVGPSMEPDSAQDFATCDRFQDTRRCHQGNVPGAVEATGATCVAPPKLGLLRTQPKEGNCLVWIDGEPFPTTKCDGRLSRQRIREPTQIGIQSGAKYSAVAAVASLARLCFEFHSAHVEGGIVSVCERRSREQSLTDPGTGR